MSHVIQLIWSFYFLILIPVMCGIAWSKLQKRKQKSLSYIYIYGYLLYFSVFYLYARIMLRIGVSFGALAKGWFVTGSILFLIAFFFGFHDIPGVIKENFAYVKKCGKETIIVTILFIAISVFSIIFVVPSEEDATPETLMVTMATDTVYLHDPYTDIVYEEPISEQAKAPIEMFYASICKYTGMTPVKFVHAVLPVTFLALFYFVYHKLAERLFQKNEKEMELFFLFVIFCYSGSIYAKRMGAFGVFQNIWMPQALLLNVVMPFVFYECVNFMNFLMTEDVGKQKKSIKRYILKFVLLFLSASLLHESGGFFVIFLLTISLLTVLIRRLYKKCQKY